MIERSYIKKKRKNTNRCPSIRYDIFKWLWLYLIVPWYIWKIENTPYICVYAVCMGMDKMSVLPFFSMQNGPLTNSNRMEFRCFSSIKWKTGWAILFYSIINANSFLVLWKWIKISTSILFGVLERKTETKEKRIEQRYGGINARVK